MHFGSINKHASCYSALECFAASENEIQVYSAATDSFMESNPCSGRSQVCLRVPDCCSYVNCIMCDSRAKPGFFLLLPSMITYGKKGNACLSLHNVALPANGTVRLEINSTNSVITEFTLEEGMLCEIGIHLKTYYIRLCVPPKMTPIFPIFLKINSPV